MRTTDVNRIFEKPSDLQETNLTSRSLAKLQAVTQKDRQDALVIIKKKPPKTEDTEALPAIVAQLESASHSTIRLRDVSNTAIVSGS